jgi:glycosyltransferase involved in cell wall biosynthesis
LLKSGGAQVEILQFSNSSHTFFNLLQLPYNRGSYKRTIKELERVKPDIVHIHNLHFAASPAVIYALKKRNVPFVMTLHNFRMICPSAILFFNGKPFLDSIKKAFPWKAIAKGVYKNSVVITFWLALSMWLHRRLGTWNIADRYIILSRHARQIFFDSKLGIPPEKFVIKPNFCSVPQTEKNVIEDAFLYVGRLSEEKGIRLLLSVFAGSKYKLKIIGDGPLKSEVVNYAAKNNNISYLGLKSKQEVFELMNSSSALVFPSIWFEGMPLTIIEAFACGTPVIASELGAMEHMVTSHSDGFLFETNNAADMEKKLQLWQQMPEEQKAAVRKNARLTYERIYTPEKNAEQLFKIYRSVLNVPAAQLHAAGV